MSAFNFLFGERMGEKNELIRLTFEKLKVAIFSFLYVQTFFKGSKKMPGVYTYYSENGAL